MQPRFIFDSNGVMKLNPDYQSTVAQPGNALAIVSSVDQVMQFNVSSQPIQMAPTTMQAINAFQEPAYANRFRSEAALDGAQMLESLTRTFMQYEVPIGMINKLMALVQYHQNFMIDNSGSMSLDSDVKLSEATPYLQARYGNSNQPMSRIQEVEDRLHILIDMLKYIPVKSITIRFMHHSQPFNLVQTGKSPDQFADEAHKIIAERFSTLKLGSGTPTYRMLSEAYTQAPDYTMHTLFTDGEPNDRAVEDIIDLVVHRKHPSRHPTTFASCTNDNADVDWLKKLEGKAKFTAEMDDFKQERNEVLEKQGRAFPYSRGFWLLSHLLASINPYDLDALDEKYPLTKMTMNELMGRILSAEDYRYYFDNHPRAKRYRRHFEEFLCEDKVARQILYPEKSLLKPLSFFSPAPVVAQQQVLADQPAYAAPLPGY